MMNKLSLLFALLLFIAPSVFCQPLFTYGNNTVSKEEFLRAYNKNKTTVADKEKSLREYLDLYTKFKLKVQAAKEIKLDTLEQLKFDTQNFRSQVEDGYMNDEKGTAALVDEALVRSQKDIHIVHFYVPINTKMNAAEMEKAHKAMEEVREELLKKNPDYNEMVDEVSEKIIPIKGKDLGFLTALSAPYQIENIVYALKEGEVSKEVRTKNALHVFKNIGERKSAGRWKVAQILLAIPPDVSGESLKTIQKNADSIYTMLQAGANFAELAKKYSEDKLTYLNGGEMPEFGTGKFELPFEQAVFDLKKNGDISKPIFTGYGFHIVKRISQQPTPADKSDEAFMTYLKQQVLQDGRMSIPKANFTKTVMAKSGYKKNTAVKDEQLFRYADSVTANKTVGNFPINKSIIFSFAKSNVKGSDWLNFVKDYKLNTDVYKGESNAELLDKYISTTAMEYYRNHLQEYNEDFKYQMQEFKEGNMLFEIMERKIWSKAASDSIGLKKYYEDKKSKYLWGESAIVYLFNCNNAKTAEEAIAALQNGNGWQKIAEDSDGKIQSDSGRYELAQLQLPAGTVAKEGLISTPIINATDNTASFVKVLKVFPAQQQRSFDEARGLVINEYQSHLEEKWIDELKKKYPVKVNEAVFKLLLK